MGMDTECSTGGYLVCLTALSGHLRKWIAAFMTVACLSCASAQEAPIEAELSKTLAGDRLEIGSTFALQVLAPWEQGECRLASGALLHATVQAVTRTNRHTQGITFMVQAPCGERKPSNLWLPAWLLHRGLKRRPKNSPALAPLE